MTAHELREEPIPLADALERLKDARRLRGTGSVQALDAAIDEVFGYSESTAITHLLLLLDDEAEFEESNWSILHAAEGIHPASYEQEL